MNSVVNELNSMLSANHDTNIDKISDINTNRDKGKKNVLEIYFCKSRQ